MLPALSLFIVRTKLFSHSKTSQIALEKWCADIEKTSRETGYFFPVDLR